MGPDSGSDGGLCFLGFGIGPVPDMDSDLGPTVRVFRVWFWVG